MNQDPAGTMHPTRRFIYFLFAGGAATAVNFLSRILYSVYLNYSASVILAYATGMAAAYFLYERFVFIDGENAAQKSLPAFVAVNLYGLLQTWAISMGLLLFVLPLTGIQSFNQEIAHGASLVCLVLSSYLLHSRFSFASH